MKRLHRTLSAATLMLAAFACQNDESNLLPVDDSPVYLTLERSNSEARKAADANKAVLYGEYLTTQESGQLGRTVYFKNVGDKQLTADFVPGLSGDGTDNVSYYIDETRPSADLSVGATSGAITRAMNTWDGLTCSALGMYKVPSNTRVKTGFVSALYGFGGSYDYTADVVHSGWLPKEFFDLLAPQGSTFILGVTFTIINTDNAGNPTDVDSNGMADVAWREIYYNDNFSWKIGNHYDVETIALHEAGHGLSQGHFGSAFIDAGSGALHFAPRAVMNAAYSGIQTQINETDNAGHCSNWSSWNNN